MGLPRESALDLASTIVVVRPGEELDRLATPAQLMDWLSSLGEPLQPGDDVALRVAAFRSLRDSIRELFVAAIAGGSLPHPPAERLNAASAAVPRYAVLDLSVPGSPLREDRGPAVGEAT